jgi:hypothetical protein
LDLTLTAAAPATARLRDPGAHPSKGTWVEGLDAGPEKARTEGIPAIMGETASYSEIDYAVGE